MTNQFGALLSSIRNRVADRLAEGELKRCRYCVATDIERQAGFIAIGLQLGVLSLCFSTLAE